MVKLYVWKTLKKNGKFHFLLGSTPCSDEWSDGTEMYFVSPSRLLLLDIFEFVCGYKRIDYYGGCKYIKFRFGDYLNE